VKCNVKANGLVRICFALQVPVSIEGAAVQPVLLGRSDRGALTQLAIQQFVLFLQCTNLFLKVLNTFSEANDLSVSNLRRLSLPWGYCLHHAKAPKCPYGQNACFTKDDGPCHKLVT
jgi:hypothetical protein